MAAACCNYALNDKNSMASELLDMISVEEYISSIPAFPSTDYLNKNELGSLKKMISGKLWTDTRKFMSRQKRDCGKWTLCSLRSNTWNKRS